jgi:hypothetical protein
MTSIVHDEQGLWTVILSYELADLSFELMLGFFSDSQLNGLRGVVEALLEQGLKLSSLADGQFLWAGHLAQGCLQRTSSAVLSSSSSSAHLIRSTAT